MLKSCAHAPREATGNDGGMRVVTWNVLHRIHALNWDEASVAAYPDESRRCDAIALQVAGWLRGDVDVVCLQEVSGDQLDAVRSAAGGAVHVAQHRHPREPRLRAAVPSPLRRPAEFLVTLTKLEHESVSAEAFDEDGGKGVLVVRLSSGVTVLNTHVTFGAKRVAQLELLSARLVAPSVLMGDFNAPLDVVMTEFGAVSCSDLRGQLPTRFGKSASDGQHIDHVIGRGVRVVDARVLDVGAWSDHRPVVARVEL